jgi:hypothetical protein
MGAKPELSKIVVTFLVGKDEIDKIEVVFTELKWITGLKKVELYGKALEWIASDEKAKAKFIEYLMNEKAKSQIMEIKE